jgi:NADH-quinone oxidoreductase subunit N
MVVGFGLLCIPAWGRLVPWLSCGGIGAVLLATLFRLLDVAPTMLLAPFTLSGSHNLAEAPTYQIGEYLLTIPFEYRAGFGVFLLVADCAALASLLWLMPTFRAKNELETHKQESSTEARSFLAFFILTALLGCHIVALSVSPILTFIGVEILSVGLYAGVAWANNERALRAALKYVLMGGFSAACLAFGLAWAYGIPFLLNQGLAGPGISALDPAAVALARQAVFALMLLAGLFKLGAFPMHGWVAEAYKHAPIAFTAFLSVAPKVAGALLVFRLAEMSGLDLASVRPLLLVTGAASVLAGNFGAFYQTRFLPLMGFSSIAHSGFMLLCLACPSPLEVAGYYALALFGINYLGLGLWGYLTKQGASEALASVAGWGQLKARQGPWLMVAAVVSALALAGLPPTFGFLAKLKLILGLAQLGSFGVQKALAYGLAAFAAINTALSLYYYLKLPFELIFRPLSTESTMASLQNKPDIKNAAPFGLPVLIAVALLLIVLFFASNNVAWLTSG